MFNLVMGIVMVVSGCISLAWGIISGVKPFPVCIGCTLIVFGIVEIIRSKSIRDRNKRRKESEMDVYLRLASEMGVVVNPITKEVVSKKNDQQESETVGLSEENETDAKSADQADAQVEEDSENQKE